MADEGPIKRQDVVDDDVLKLPKELAEGFKGVVVQLDAVIQRLKTVGGGISQATTVPKLKKETDELTESQKQLEKIQNQITIATAKNNEEYAKQTKLLNEEKQALKDKILLGDRDSKSINQQNSSRQVLGAAMNKNIRDYSNLKTEQERASKSGVELKEIIDKQRKGFESLSDGLGEHQEHVGDYAGQLGFLNKELGESAEKVVGFGKSFLELAASGPGAILAGIGAAVLVVTKSLEAYFETTDAGEVTLQKFQGQVDGVKGSINKLFAELGKKIVGESITEKLKGLVANIPGLSILLALFEAAGEKGLKLTEKEIELADELVSRTIERSQQENEATKDILGSQDKIINSDEKRLELAKEAFRIREESLKEEQDIAKKELEILVEKIHLSTNDPTVAQKQAVADAEAKIIDLETQSLQLRKRNAKEIVTLTLEIEKARRDAEVRIKNSAIDLRKSELALIVKTNEDIIANEDSTLQQRQSALTQATSAEFELLKKDREQQLINAENGAKERLIARNNEYATNKDFLNKALTQDESFGKEKLKIEQDYLTKSENVAANYAVTFKSNLAKGFTEATTAAKRATDEQLDLLNVQFNAGAISFKEYEGRKQKIDKQSKIDLLHSQIEYQQQSLYALEAFGFDTAKAQKALDDLEVLEADAVAKRKLDIEKRLHEEKLKLANEFVDAVAVVGGNLYDADIARLDARSKALKQHYDEDIANAGDNQNLKDKLQAKYDEKQKQIDIERVQQERRKAEFEKKLAETKVIINTAEAVSNYLGALPESAPFIAFAVAEGLLQLAVIQSAPLPQYAEGTDSAKGGWSIVGELGTEMYVTPTGRLGFTGNQAELMNVEQGTKIYTHEETMSALAMAGMYGNNYAGTREEAKLVEKLDEVKQAIGNSKPDRINHIASGLELLEVTRTRNNFTKIMKDITMGKWISR